MAKKLLYRATDFTARDVFDLAFLIERNALDDLMVEEATYLPQLRIVLQRITTHRAALGRAFDRIATNQYTPTFDHCIAVIKDFVQQREAAT
jgi:hypothetical protein